MFVKQNSRLTQDVFALELSGEFAYDKVQPGQFVNLLIGDGQTHPLRRPLSIAACNTVAQTITLVYRVVGSGTKYLSELKDGAIIDVLGPLGKGFPLTGDLGRVLIVGGGVGIPPLYGLAKELYTKGFSVDIILGFKNQEDVFWIEEFAEYGQVTVCTEDGSLGEKGFITAGLKENKRWTTLYSCGPKAMLKALKNHFEGVDLQGFVSLEEQMACGVGACWGCTCQSADGSSTKRVCKEGPVFNWEEVAL